MKSVMPGTCASLGLEPADDTRGVRVPLVQRLQIDLNPSAVHRGVDTINTDERRQAGNGRVLQNDLGQRLLPLRHGHEGNRFRCLRDAQDDARILNREEAFGNRDVEQDSADQGGERHKQCERLMSQNPLQAFGRIGRSPN